MTGSAIDDAEGATSVDGRERALGAFRERYGAPPTHVARAPGRVNLIGDHTDYNDGYVLPMALDRAVWIACRPSDAGRVSVHSVDLGETADFSLDPIAASTGAWVEYVRGVAWALRDAGHAVMRGWEGVMASDVPVGAGLSSSAAVELSTARAFAAVNDIVWEPATMALLAQRAENQWVGVNCGIMDQMVSAAGVAGSALLIDCRSLTTQAVPLPPRVAVVVLDTGTRRGLVDSAYNERRSQCEAAAAFFGVPALRDVERDAFEKREWGLPRPMSKRARHVISENARTLASARALEHGDIAEVGRLMDESHASLRDDFEVSRAELDTMVTIARAHDGCHGARMTGAGFGGCAVALVDAAAAPRFAADVAERYGRETGIPAKVYVSAAARGAEIAEL